MTNNRQAGKRWERWFARRLKSIFPNIRRNAGIQSQSGGRDLEETGDFAFEVKGGKSYKFVGIRKILDQTKEEKGNKKYAIGLVKPSREEAYALIPFEDFLRLLKELQ